MVDTAAVATAGDPTATVAGRITADVQFVLRLAVVSVLLSDSDQWFGSGEYVERQAKSLACLLLLELYCGDARNLVLEQEFRSRTRTLSHTSHTIAAWRKASS